MNRTEKFRRKRKLRLVLAATILVLAAGFCLLIFKGLNSLNIREIFNEASGPSSGHGYDAPEKNKKADMPVTAAVDNSSTVLKAQTVDPKYDPIANNFFSEIIKDKASLKEYKRDYNIIFGAAEDYSDIAGITCFRGNNYRNSPSYGYADIKEGKLEKVWFVKNGYIDIWTGVGWTGQPSIIQWDEKIKNKMNIVPIKKSKKGLKEIIYATLDGKIYFLDLDDGKPTRSPIDVGYSHKGSVVVDPRGLPLLYAGQGIPDKAGKKVPIGYRIFSLLDQRILHFINGYDPDAFRHWGAFDSGALIDKRTDTLIECGENGILYTVRLNTSFDLEKSNISIKPDMVKYRYRSPISTKIGTENSPVIYRNYIYFADNSGLLQCVDLNTLKPVWIRDVSDDTDSTMVLEEVKSESEVYLYTACEIDRQGKNGFSYIRKINAYTGELVWEKPVKCSYDQHTNGGALASPVLGKNDIKDLVIYNIAKTGKKNNGSKLLALDRKTGKEIWVVDLPYYCWSSPVDIYTRDGKSYLIVCDSGGYMNLFEGISGKKLDSIPLEANIEASPAVFENMIVVGTRGQKIWGIRVK